MRMLILAMTVLFIACIINSVPAANGDDGTGHQDIELDVLPALEQDVYQDDQIQFTIGVRNADQDGTMKDFDLSVEDEAETGVLTLSLDPSTIENLDASATEDVILTVSASTATTIDVHTLNFNVTDRADENIAKTVSLTVNVMEKPDYEVSIDFDTTAREITLGDTDEIEITITNEASVEDTLIMFQDPPENDFVRVVFVPGTKVVAAGEPSTVMASIVSQKEGTVSISIGVKSGNDEDKTDDKTITITVKPAGDGGDEEKGFLESDVAGIPLIALFGIIIVVPVVAVVILQKRKKKTAAPGAQPGMPGAVQGVPGMPGMPGYGMPQPMVMHCPNCGGVIEIANPAMPQPVQCRHCGSQYNFPGTGQQVPPVQQAYGAPPAQAAMQQTPCPACRTPIPIPPQRPVTVVCPGCGAQYNIN
ncbi:MAG: hypothetical protein L0Z54_05430 [Thermoplasmata archaeon]|nr:hypothetical protein [Thermoplasmata archaeon]